MYYHAVKGTHGVIIAIVYDREGYSEEPVPDDTPNGYTVFWFEGRGVMDVNEDAITAESPNGLIRRRLLLDSIREGHCDNSECTSPLHKKE
jgi:hypothetical protein